MDSSPSRGNTQLPSVAGVKRRASLLPAFEPLSSSPSLPRPLKRVRDASAEQGGLAIKYPTPLPTSSTDIIPSSPPCLAPSRRPRLQRTHSTVSERAPLSAVPAIVLDESGEPVLMGRSSASCQYQLSSDRLISRVHVRAAFVAGASLLEPDRIEIACLGWNGIRVHCQGKTYELGKGKTFSTEKKGDIMVDVQPVRVLLQWPKRNRKDSASAQSDSTWDDENSPRRHIANQGQSVQLSPLRNRQRLVSPVSPSPAVHATQVASFSFLPGQSTQNPVQVYEDVPSPDAKEVDMAAISQSTQHVSQVFYDVSQSSEFNSAEDFSDHDEENDPIIHSFGPFGANILPRMESFTTAESPSTSRATKPPPSSPPLPNDSSSPNIDDSNIRNHVINQLAFSRLSSTPLSTLLGSLPTESVQGSSSNASITTEQLAKILRSTECIGEVAREGKDAAGKPLESEFYYIPDLDEDEKRKEAVVNNLMKPGLRACRKQHKVCSGQSRFILRSCVLIGHDSAILLETGQAPLARSKPILPGPMFLHQYPFQNFLVLSSQRWHLDLHSVASVSRLMRFMECCVFPPITSVLYFPALSGRPALLPRMALVFGCIPSGPKSGEDH
jgi:hypothetical protein